MLRALRTTALGMQAQQMNVDNIANNLANVNTTGFKKSSIEFQDLLYQSIQNGNAENRYGNVQPAELQIGHGNRAVATFKTFSQGAITETGNPLDVGINGDGFYVISQADGTEAYSRDGSFHVNPEGYIVNSSGLLLNDGISIPDDAVSVSVSQDGVVSVLMSGETTPEEVGQIELVRFMNPSGLNAIGGNLFVETVSSGSPTFNLPSENGTGNTIQGYLEKSNVDVVTEMIDLIVAQRSYEINSKAVRTADEMLQIANQIKR